MISLGSIHFLFLLLLGSAGAYLQQRRRRIHPGHIYQQTHTHRHFTLTLTLSSNLYSTNGLKHTITVVGNQRKPTRIRCKLLVDSTSISPGSRTQVLFFCDLPLIHSVAPLSLQSQPHSSYLHNGSAISQFEVVL